MPKIFRTNNKSKEAKPACTHDINVRWKHKMLTEVLTSSFPCVLPTSSLSCPPTGPWTACAGHRLWRTQTSSVHFKQLIHHLQEIWVNVEGKVTAAIRTTLPSPTIVQCSHKKCKSSND